MKQSFRNRHVMILGMARSGIAAAKLLSDDGAFVRINDLKTEEQLSEAIKPLKGIENIEWRLGEKAEDVLDGIDVLVISPGVPIESSVVKTARDKGIEVIGELELSYRMSEGWLVCITGTNGKTTTTTLTGEIFKAAGKKTYVVGNIGYPYAAVAGEAKEGDVTVCEASSFQMESVDQFRPNVSCITNIREDHLNRHHTMECYARTKAHIFRRQDENDVLVLNYNDEYLRNLAKTAKATVVWFGNDRKNNAVPPFGAFELDGSIVYGTKEKHEVVCGTDELLIPGPHNLENTMAAVAMTMASGVSAQAAAEAIRSFKGVEHRVEFVRELAGVRFVDDSEGTNADSTQKAVETMTAPSVLILGGSDKKNDFTELCKGIKDSPYIDSVVLIGQTAAQFDETLKKVGFTGSIYNLGRDFEGAIKKAFALCPKGGSVLLSPACASFDMFHNCEERGDIFKDIVNKLTEDDI